MKLHFYHFLLLFSLTLSFGQAEIATINDVYKNRVIMPNEVIGLVDEPNDRFALVLLNRKMINGFLFDASNQLSSKIVSKEKMTSYKQVLGKTVLKNNDFVVFMTNNSRSKFASAQFSFDDQNISFKELELDLGKEKIIQTADYNNHFHVLTITPRSGILNIYRFEDATSFSKFPIDLSRHNFLNGKEKEVDLYDMITVKSGMYGFNKSIDIVKIEANDPNSLEVACEPNKLYQNNEFIIITFDSNEETTQVVEVNLEKMEGKVKEFKKAFDNLKYKDKNSNSFYCDDILYQIMVTKNILYLSAINYNTGETIKAHSASVNQKIGFKNSMIIQTGGTFDDHREFEDTATLIRKVNRGKAGVSAFKTGEQYQITYGGVIEREVSGGPMMMPGFGIPIASMGAVTVFFNPTFFAYQSYTHTKALFVDALFNPDFEHQEGEIDINIFDKIEKFENENNISPVGRTVFKMNDSYIHGTYEAYYKTYTLRSF